MADEKNEQKGLFEVTDEDFSLDPNDDRGRIAPVSEPQQANNVIIKALLIELKKIPLDLDSIHMKFNKLLGAKPIEKSEELTNVLIEIRKKCKALVSQQALDSQQALKLVNTANIVLSKHDVPDLFIHDDAFSEEDDDISQKILEIIFKELKRVVIILDKDDLTETMASLRWLNDSLPPLEKVIFNHENIQLVCNFINKLQILKENDLSQTEQECVVRLEEKLCAHLPPAWQPSIQPISASAVSSNQHDDPMSSVEEPGTIIYACTTKPSEESLEDVNFIYNRNEQLSLHQEKLLKSEGLEVYAPMSGVPYTLTFETPFVRTSVNPSKKIHRASLQLSECTDNDSRALTIINMIENIVSKGQRVNIKTKNIEAALYAHAYYELVLEGKFKDLKYRNTSIGIKNDNRLPDQYSKQYESIRSKMNKILEKRGYFEHYENAPWFKAAIALRDNPANQNEDEIEPVSRPGL